MTNVAEQLTKSRKEVISDAEVEEMKSIILTWDLYECLRGLAILALFDATGKRREEVSSLEVGDVVVKDPNLSVTFTVVKKRRDQLLSKRREKQVPLESWNAKSVLNYLNWMRENQPKCKYLFPSRRAVFGHSFSYSLDKHLSGRQVLRIVKMMSPRIWCHLFRETAGAEVVREDSSIFGVFKVMMRLDLEKESTAWNYMRRYAIDVINK